MNAALAPLSGSLTSASRERLLVVGNGMAAHRLLDRLTGSDAAARFDITVVGAEPVAAYNRVLLSAVLAGETTRAAIGFGSEAWYAARGITALLGDGVAAIDRVARTATLASGRVLGWDRLVLATGSRAIRLPMPGADLAGVVTFRDLADLDAIEAFAATGRPAVVIGGGLLGIEAAFGLAAKGIAVTLVHLMDRLMERQLDPRGAALVARALTKLGVRVELGATSQAIEGDTRVEGLRLGDGRVLPAGLVVMAVGVRPETALAAEAGLAVGRGIAIDDGLRTSDERIFAIGECAEHRAQTYGLVAPAYDMAETLAATLIGRDATFEGAVLATNLKVSGLPVFSAGDFEGAAGTETILFEDRPLGHYRKLVVAGDRLVGVVLVGETTDGPWYLDLIRSGASIAAIRRDLVCGRPFCEAA